LVRKGEVYFIGEVIRSGEVSEIKIYPEFCEGLEGLEQFSHAIVLYWLHQRDDEKNRRTLKVTPRRHTLTLKVGVFATRSPSRPNPIGLCVVKIDEIKGCTLFVVGLDAFEGSPIIDVKPYLPRADVVIEAEAPEWTSKGPKT